MVEAFWTDRSDETDWIDGIDGSDETVTEDGDGASDDVPASDRDGPATGSVGRVDNGFSGRDADSTCAADTIDGAGEADWSDGIDGTDGSDGTVTED
jgi:hypothetical protein